MKKQETKVERKAQENKKKNSRTFILFVYISRSYFCSAQFIVVAVFQPQILTNVGMPFKENHVNLV